MHNKDIRQAIERSGLKYWQVAERYGLSDGNFSRKLRKELPQYEKDKIYAVIEQLKSEVE